MFKVLHEPEFTREIHVRVPEGDAHTDQSFSARFRVVEEDDEREIVTTSGMKAFLRRAIVSLYDIADEHGQPVPYSEELRDRVLNFAFARLALMRAYSEAVTQVKTGN